MVHKRLLVILGSILITGCAVILSTVFAPTAYAESRTIMGTSTLAADCPFLSYYAGYNNSAQERHNVAILQSRLNNWLAQHDNSHDGLPKTIAVDGYFGPQTLATVEAVQSYTFGTFDGLVGPHTWQALGGCEAPSSSLNGL